MSAPSRRYYLALQQHGENLWRGIPSPGEHVPLRLLTKGHGPSTMIERVWVPLGPGEIVLCKEPVWAGSWGTQTRARFPAPLQHLTQQLGQRLEVHARVVGPLDALLLLCVDRAGALYAADDLDDVRQLARAQPV